MAIHSVFFFLFWSIVRSKLSLNALFSISLVLLRGKIVLITKMRAAVTAAAAAAVAAVAVAVLVDAAALVVTAKLISSSKESSSQKWTDMKRIH